VATTTVRLNSTEEQTLDELAEVYGGRSNALREGLRLLAATKRQQAALSEMLHDWEAEAGPVDEEAVTAMADRYGL
jgi:Arc/MetJ-type ribon-helix-helix transcriptional regulator